MGVVSFMQTNSFVLNIKPNWPSQKVTISPHPGRLQAVKTKATQQGKKKSKDSTAKKPNPSEPAKQAGKDLLRCLLDANRRRGSWACGGRCHPQGSGKVSSSRAPWLEASPFGRCCPCRFSPPVSRAHVGAAPAGPSRILDPRPSCSASGPRRTYRARRLPRPRLATPGAHDAARCGDDLGAAEGGTVFCAHPKTSPKPGTDFGFP